MSKIKVTIWWKLDDDDKSWFPYRIYDEKSLHLSHGRTISERDKFTEVELDTPEQPK